MGKLEDLKNKTFSEWTVLERDWEYTKNANRGVVPKKTMWICQCTCGEVRSVSTGDLKNGKSKSCGHDKYIIISKTTKGIKKKLNEYDLSGDFGIGYTSKGEEFYFDILDYDRVKIYSWYLKDGYPTTNENNKTLKMHRLITNCPDNMVVDHINRIRNDNRSINLRICEQADNVKNTPLYSNNKSGCKGVNFNKGKWVVRISVDNKRMFIGEYRNYEDAVVARKEAEDKYWKK